jgi:hypothetical protein
VAVSIQRRADRIVEKGGSLQVNGLDTSYDGIAIIDGLSTADRAQYRDSDKLRALVADIDNEFLGPSFEPVGREQYFQAFRQLAKWAREKKRHYLVHLECHGSPEGLVIGSDTILWEDQVGVLRDLNSAMGGTLVLDVMACNAIYGSRMSALRKSPPTFYGIIGPARLIAMDCAAVVCAAFYRSYFDTLEFNTAISMANALLGHTVIKGIRSEAFAKLAEAGFPFRPDAGDDKTVYCRPDGTVYIAS